MALLRLCRGCVAGGYVMALLRLCRGCVVGGYVMAMLRLYHGCAVGGYVMAMLRLCHGCVAAAAMPSASAGREAVLWLPSQPGEKTRLQLPQLLPFPSIPQLSLACPGFGERYAQRQQRDNWCYEQEEK